MKKQPSRLVYALCSALCALHGFVVSAHAAPFPDAAPRAGTNVQANNQSGLIQNVQSYSSNPFYNPASPYNQRMPVPIYAQGTELGTADCRGMVSYLIASECAGRNNCHGLRVADIRPAVINGLAAQPGHNYMTQCNGYIDGAFADYQRNTQTLNPSAFPTPGTAGAPGSGGQLVLKNPLKMDPPEWLGGMIGRVVEMGNLQKQNSEPVGIYAATMPKTYDDLSFQEKLAVQKEGYEQWAPVYEIQNGSRVCIKNCVYSTIRVESDADRYARETTEMKAQAETMRQRALLEEAKAKMLKASDYCEWCRHDQATCWDEQTKKMTETNEALLKTACANWNKSATGIKVDGWRKVDPDPADQCYKVENASEDEQMVLSHENCGKTPPEKQCKYEIYNDDGRVVRVEWYNIGETSECTDSNYNIGTQTCQSSGNWTSPCMVTSPTVLE
ncbi:MAG: hypothetical protein LBK26_02700 [Rickettsiales bacterium]|jgi:hypothetical protein|nr:hypothetical protein [Rickettsiales bacterium]